MKASKLRQVITVLKHETTKSPSGATKTVWTDYKTLYCSFEPLSVKDILTVSTSNSQIIARCVVRQREDIKGSMRVKYRSKLYEIVGEPLEDPISGRDYMTLTLKKVE